MPCTSPLDAWPAPPDAPDRRPVFSPARSYRGARAFSIPCGRCDSCRLERRQAWATRGLHELTQHQAASFLTLTFDDEHLPADRAGLIREWQLFRKRLREAEGAFRFITAGERGDLGGRFHLHSIIYGLDFASDRQPVGRSFGGVLYGSPRLDRIWSNGHARIAEVNASTIGYTCGYTAKKVGADGDDRPFFSVSRGIGAEWFNRYRDDAFPSDFLIRDGRKIPVPRYYVERLSDDEKAAIKAKRLARAEERRDEQRDSRLLTKHESAKLRAARRLRSLDDAT